MPYQISKQDLGVDPNVFSFSRHEQDLKIAPGGSLVNMQEIRSDPKKMEPNRLEGLHARKFTLEYTIELVQKLFEKKLLYNNK